MTWTYSRPTCQSLHQRRTSQPNFICLWHDQSSGIVGLTLAQSIQDGLQITPMSILGDCMANKGAKIPLGLAVLTPSSGECLRVAALV